MPVQNKKEAVRQGLLHGEFYTITYALSNKMKHIESDPTVAIAGEWFTAHGKGVSPDSCNDLEAMRKLLAFLVVDLSHSLYVVAIFSHRVEVVAEELDFCIAFESLQRARENVKEMILLRGSVTPNMIDCLWLIAYNTNYDKRILSI